MRKRPEFRERLAEGVILSDGAIGTYLHRRGVPLDHCFPQECLTAPELVEAIHREYADAGAEILKTNTYGAHRLALERYGLAEQVRRINTHACRLARQASEGRCYVAGSVGPLGVPLAPLGEIGRAHAAEIFEEQIRALEEGGADLILIETISDLEEFDVALAAARRVTDLPVVIEKTFTEDGRTLMGELPGEVVERARAGGADAVGANCTVGPQRMLDIVQRMAERAELPLSAMPTAGLPRLVDGRVDYHAEPGYMARYARLLAEAGATIVGACCGSTPEHIAAMRAELDRAPVRVRRVRRSVAVERRGGAEACPLAERSRLGAALGREFVVAVEFDLPRGHDLEPSLAAARRLHDLGVEFFLLADALQPRLVVSPTVFAYRVQEQVGVECVLAYSSRDKNVLGIQSDLLAAHVFGVHDVLVADAEVANFGDYPTARTLYDVGTLGLVRILEAMNRGVDLAGNPIGEPTRFVPLVSTDLREVATQEGVARLRAHVRAGAVAVVVRPAFELAQVEEAIAALAPLQVPVICSVLPLRSAEQAEYLHHEVPGIRVPEGLRRRLAAAADPAEVGLMVARELLHALPCSGAAGAIVVPPYRQRERAVSVLAALGVAELAGGRVGGR